MMLVLTLLSAVKLKFQGLSSTNFLYTDIKISSTNFLYTDIKISACDLEMPLCLSCFVFVMYQIGLHNFV